MGSQESIHLLCICDICICFARVCPCIHSCSPFFCVDVPFDSSHQELPLVAKSRSNNRRMWPRYPGSNMVLWYNQHFCLCFSSCILMFSLQLEAYCLHPFTWSSSQCVWLHVHHEWRWHRSVLSSVCTRAHTTWNACSLLMALLQMQLQVLFYIGKPV